MKNEHTSALCPACGSDCNERDELEKAEREINRLRAAPQQAEPVMWAVCDPSGEAIYAALFKTRCVEYMDNEYRYGHGAAKHWAVRPAFAHPPAAEVQRLREALKPFAAIDLTTNQAVDAMDVLRARRALEGK